MPANSSVPPPPSSVGVDNDAQQIDGDTVYQKRIYDPPYFSPLTADDEFDLFDIELQVEANGKASTGKTSVGKGSPGKAELTVRTRHGSNTRPIYKIEKSVRAHLLGKKVLNIVIQRSEAWDSTKGETLKSKGHRYIPIWEGFGQGTRDISVKATSSMVLVGTSHGGSFSMTSYCGSYDPQRSRLPQPRDCLSHHFFPIHLTKFENPRPQNGKNFSPQGSAGHMQIPDALLKPYAGGGYFVFDCHSRGRNELLTTLYCTGYEKRHRVREGDIALAELRLPVLPMVDSNKSSQPTWSRFMKERHAVLHISKRGVEAVFCGPEINMTVPNSEAGSRYSLSKNQAHEIVISAVSMMLLAIENGGLEKKWQWLNHRTRLEGILKDGSPGLADTLEADKSSLIDNSSSFQEVIPDDGSGVIDPWMQRPSTPSSHSQANEDPLIRTSGDSPDSENTGEEPFTPVDDRSMNVNPQGPGYVFAQSPSVYSQEEPRNRIELDGNYLNNQNVEETKGFYQQAEATINPQHSFHHPAAHQVPNGQYFPPNQGPMPLQPTTFYSPQPQSFNHPVVGPPLAHHPQRPITIDGHRFPQGRLPSLQQQQQPPVSQRLPVPLPIPVHPASLTLWAEDTRPTSDSSPDSEAVNITRKEGPKVTGRPKPGVEGGIFW
ncbi:hypothetical protein AAF712_013448 [Marasmius tenuissimus]|uniref:Uncharacterized protein n=1 Tax=Marasmius tenuissimus TaxID=585030 RepID=A0ABR2ZDR1_9AGAR